MPSLEHRDEEEEENETVSTIGSDEQYPLDLPKDDEDDPPDLPLPVRDDLQEDNDLQEHHAPPSDVEITETESVSVHKGMESG